LELYPEELMVDCCHTSYMVGAKVCVVWQCIKPYSLSVMNVACNAVWHYYSLIHSTVKL